MAWICVRCGYKTDGLRKPFSELCKDGECDYHYYSLTWEEIGMNYPNAFNSFIRYVTDAGKYVTGGGEGKFNHRYVAIFRKFINKLGIHGDLAKRVLYDFFDDKGYDLYIYKHSTDINYGYEESKRWTIEVNGINNRDSDANQRVFKDRKTAEDFLFSKAMSKLELDLAKKAKTDNKQA